MKYKRKKTGELALMEYIWRTREHVSFLSGKGIKYFCPSVMAHVIPKSKREDLRLRKDNIIILTREEHNLLDAGTIKQREEYALREKCNWQKIYDLKEKLMNERRTVSIDPHLEMLIAEECGEKFEGFVNVTTYKKELGDEVDFKIDIVVWTPDFKDMLHNKTFGTLNEVRDWLKNE